MSLFDRILGRSLASEEEEEQKIGVAAGVPMLGLDGLSSSAYGPEAALTVLLPLGVLGPGYFGPIILIILAILTVLYFSYRQTIAAYPLGGGSYTVAKENLGVPMGLLAAAALLLDYILNVAVGISAGIGALVSAVPALHGHILALCLATLALITLVNLRGIRESGGAFLIPTYLFVGTLGIVLLLGVFKTLASAGHPQPISPPAALPAATTTVSLWLLMRAFASGCTAMTGVEAVSNGVSAFAEPAVQRAQRTLTAIVVILGLLLGGIAYLCRVYGIGATDPDSLTYQSVISQLVGAVVGRSVFYYVTIGSVLAVLALSANTSFAGFPRLCRLLAEDDFLPHAFAIKGRRLVYSHGILILAALAGVLLITFGGITDRLIPLFAVGAFLAFTLSQAGMVAHWKRRDGAHASTSLVVNGVGAAATGIALAVVLIAKLRDGAWITVLIIPATLFLFYKVKGHYDCVHQEIKCARPLDLSHLQPPVVIVPITGWTTVAEKALSFALRLSDDVTAVHISTSEPDVTELRAQWEQYVEPPLIEAGLTQPCLVFLSSPYRLLVTPLLTYIKRVREAHPERLITVIIPELVEARWYQYLLHNHRATILKAALLLRGDQWTIVVNVPWYLGMRPPR